MHSFDRLLEMAFALLLLTVGADFMLAATGQLPTLLSHRSDLSSIERAGSPRSFYLAGGFLPMGQGSKFKHAQHPVLVMEA